MKYSPLYKTFSFLLVLSILSVNPAFSMTCSDLLGYSLQETNSLEDIKNLENPNSLKSVDSKDLMVSDTAEPKVYRIKQTKGSPLEVVSDYQSALVRLINAEIIESDFFKEILKKTNGNKELSKNKIRLMTQNQLSEFSVQVFANIEQVFDKKLEQADLLDDPLASLMAFNSVDPGVIMTAISGSIILISDRGYVSKAKMVSTRRNIKPKLAQLVTFSLISVMLHTSVYLMANVEDLDILSNSIFQITSLITLVSFILNPTRYGLRRLKAESHIMKKLLIAHEEAFIDVDFINLERQRFAATEIRAIEKLLNLKERIDQIKSKDENKVPSESELITFGVESSQLHAELIKIFTHDIMNLMNFYGTSKEEIRKRLLEIKHSPETLVQNKNTIQFLTQMFYDAFEATVEAGSLSTEVIAMLTADLKTLNSLDLESVSEDYKRDFVERSNSLRVSIEIHQGFVLHLDYVRRIVSTVLNGLNQLDLAESAALVNNMGKALNSINTPSISGVDSILEGLDGVDTFIERDFINEDLPVIEAKTLYDSSKGEIF